MFDDADPLLRRVRELALALPDAAEKVSHGIPAFYTTKVFAYYGGSITSGGVYQRHEHSLLVLPDAEDRLALLEDERCYVPAYLGPSGWIGLDLDHATDWNEMAELIQESYRRTAGPRRVARLTQTSRLNPASGQGSGPRRPGPGVL
jgi:predicted DNA-binding protein (MmcQ/YjbR family)